MSFSSAPLSHAMRVRGLGCWLKTVMRHAAYISPRRTSFTNQVHHCNTILVANVMSTISKLGLYHRPVASYTGPARKADSLTKTAHMLVGLFETFPVARSLYESGRRDLSW